MERFNESNCVRLGTISLFLGFCILFFLLAGSIQGMAAEQGGEKSQSKDLQKAQQKMRKYSQKLKDIQSSALENNPELQDRIEEFQKLQKEKVQEYVDENASRQEQFKAQMKLRNDKELKKKSESIRNDMLKAMEKEDPKTKDYLEELTNARKEVMQQQGNKGSSLKKKMKNK